MNARKEFLRRRRERLVAQAAAQRVDLADITSHLQDRIRWLERGYVVGQALRRHPLLAVAGGSLLLPAGKSSRLLWVSRLFTAWGLFSMVRKRW
jgi:hypothetical protein